MSEILLSHENYKHAHVPVTLSMSYLHFNSGSEKPLLIFFHGYSDSALSFLRRAIPDLDSQFEILAPNGLFPVPVKTEMGWKRAFAWYFADYSKQDVLVPPEISAQAVENLVRQLHLVNRPKVLVGFSQGGFFLPFVLPHLKHVKKIFSVGAAYRLHDYPETLDITLDALHGKDDEIIAFDHAQQSFDELKSTRNPEGQFFGFAGLGHKMNDESRALLKSRIKEAFR